jgi:hypothetical protein
MIFIVESGEDRAKLVDMYTKREIDSADRSISEEMKIMKYAVVD